MARGILRELDRSVGGYETDDRADALLEIGNDRLAMLATRALDGAESAEELLDRAAGCGYGRCRCSEVT